MKISDANIRAILISTFLSIITAATILFKFIERESWLNSFYFVIVTLSTVGYGDVVAHTPSSKIIVIILIITGILAIAIGSQLIFDRIIKFQLNRTTLLPSNPLDYHDHVVIAGYGAKGRRIAEIFRDRFVQVIIVEKDIERAKLAEYSGFEILRADITKPGVLRILSLDRANAICLLLTNDSATIQTAILARSFSEDLRIYAEISSLPTYDIIKFAGVDRPISQVDFLANVIRSHLYHYGIQLLHSPKSLILQEASFGIIQVHDENDGEEFLKQAYPIGSFSSRLNEFYLTAGTSSTIYSNPTEDCEHVLYAMKQEALQDFDKSLRGMNPIPHDRIIFAGYGEYVNATLNRLEISENEEIIILYEDGDNVAHITDSRYELIPWNINTARDLLDEIIDDKDLVICSFQDITNSLYLAVNLRDLNRGTHFIQLVPYEYNIDAFVKVGAEVVLAPQLIIANAIISTYTQDNQIPPSLIFTNGHLFEHFVQDNDPIVGVQIKKLVDKKINIIYIIDPDTQEMVEPDMNYRIQFFDRVMIWVDHRPTDFVQA
ncbi:MAG: Calcium-gated potassium channel MthK [Candidatus Heimdallarchaeota archaeon LC_2]|nr:MAG: Calcium-gated potassium channel MthK [Candidatus Heimdallarchaeota archaeon LC_2]